jgi:branched-chain amino acid transport system substrate-binding protein
MNVSRRIVLASAASAFVPSIARAQEAPIRIGVLGDQNGPYADFSGPGCAIAARLAAEDFGGHVLGRPIEILSADHRNKPELAVSIAREWIDNQGVQAVLETSTSGAAMALQPMMREKKRIFLIVIAGTSDLTNKACSPFGFHFNCDTYALAHSTGGAVTKMGGNSWFFITVDYAFGHALERDTSRFVTEAGGKVLGSVRHPLGNADFSSYLQQAQSSGAKVIAFANAGADAQNAIKQAVEFGMNQDGRRLVALLFFITDILAIGLPKANGLVLTNTFYWDQSDATRQWTKRFMAHKSRVPSMNQAAAYASARHFLRAVQSAGTTETERVADTMRALPVEDMYNDHIPIRADGRVLSRMHLMQAKAPAASRYPGDVYNILGSTPGAEAFRPVAESECNLLQKA